MIEAYLTLANRIRSEMDDLERIVSRSEKAVKFSREHPEDQDLYLDSAALNLHGFYSGLERIAYQIATVVDGEIPTHAEWHRDLLRQMGLDLPGVRPPIFTASTIEALDEYLRFRHVVRNVYTFSFLPDQIARLVQQVRLTYFQIKNELFIFIEFLEKIGQ